MKTPARRRMASTARRTASPAASLGGARPYPSSSPAEFLQYGWITDPRTSILGLDGCVSAATRTTPDSVLRAFGADPAAPPVPFDSAQPMGGVSGANVAICGHGEEVLAAEVNGCQGARSEVLAEASRYGRAASVYWSLDVDVQIALAERGEILCRFDPAGINRRRDSEAAADLGLLSWNLAELNLSHPDWVALGVVLMRRFTGVAPTPAMLNAIDQVHLLQRETPIPAR